MSNPSTSRYTQLPQDDQGHRSTNEDGLLKRSWHAVLSPFSSAALDALPDTSQRNRDRELRTDRIPEALASGEGADVMRETVVSDAPSRRRGAGETLVSVRVPKKIPTAIKVEGKVWFANERSTLS